MGILNTLSKNPTLIALGALGIGLFIFRDKISGFFSDITGGIEGAKELGETAKVLNENLLSNLKGIQDLLSGEFFKDFKLPEFKFPEFNFDFPEFKFPEFNFPIVEIPVIPSPDVPPERMDVPFPTEEDPSKTIDIVPDVTGGRGDRLRDVIDKVIDITNPQGLMGDIAKAIVPETQAEFQERAAGLVETFPETFRSTSLTDQITFGRQLSRESEDFESVLAAEARRSEEIFAKLFGNVQNPNF